MTDQSMTPERWARVRDLFDRALALDPAERPAFVVGAEEGDTQLRDVVLTLIRSHEQQGPISVPMGESTGAGTWSQRDDEDRTVARLADELSDRYQFVERIGMGGMAVVYLAEDKQLGRRVALKIMSSRLEAAEGAQRFLQEVRLAANLQHPNILAVHDSGEAAGMLYYVMPFVEGESLRHQLSRDGGLSHQTVIAMARGVAAALDYAHQRDVVHRDIKPDNILFHEDHPLVADFGIALALDNRDGERMTKSGLLIGTPTYMSPEQITGAAVDGGTDRYALACVVFECLTGTPPYLAPTAMAVATKHVTEPIPAVPAGTCDAPQRVNAVFRSGLAKSPGDRFATATDFVETLAEALSMPAEAVEGRVGPYAPSTTPVPVTSGPSIRDQTIRFCRSRDGVNIAYATIGEGIPLIKTSNWLSHLEYDWKSPMWRHWWAGLGKRSRLTRYDARGTGLSDRNTEDISLAAWVKDLETVVDAVGEERFALLGISQGGSIAIEYAIRHPERVSHLILYGAFAIGRLVNPTPEDEERARLDMSLIKHGWGQSNPAFRQVFSTLFMPHATQEQFEWFDKIQRVSATAEIASRIVEASHRVDVRASASKVTVPTLVLHCTDDARIPFEQGRLFARLIPEARFVPLESENHILQAGEPAWPKFLEAIWQFLDMPSNP